jgi:hypothetical protein
MNETCSLATVPFTALVGRSDWNSTAEGAALFDFLSGLEEDNIIVEKSECWGRAELCLDRVDP